MKVFSKEKFIEEMGKNWYEGANKHCIDECDGKEVVDGVVIAEHKFYVHSDWCIEKPDGKVTMEDFINRKVAVQVGCGTEKELDEFLRICEISGLVWMNDKKATEFKPCAFGNETVVAVSTDRKRIGQGYVETYEKIEVGIVKISDFLKGVKKNKYKIEIECDGDLTTAKMIIDGKVVKTSEAKRNPADDFKWRIGAEFAFERLWEKEKKPTYKEVKRKAKVGEYVRIVKSSWAGNKYKVGEIYKVVGYYNADIYGGKHAILSCGEPYANERDYVVLEGYKGE